MQPTASPIAGATLDATRTPGLRRVLRWIIPALAIVGLAWAGSRVLKSRQTAPIQFETAAVDRGPIAAKVTANGALSALVTVNVGSQVSGRIESLGADFESHVRRGQVVATIEPSLFRAALQQAIANKAAADAAREHAVAQRINVQHQYVRSQELLDQRLIAPADNDTAEAALGIARADERAAAATCAQAKAMLDQAALNLHYTTIVSPIDGVVISRNVDVGQTVAAALQAPTLFTIAQDLSRMQVDTNVAEADVGKLRAGMEVSFSVDAYPGHVFTDKLRQVRDNAQTLQNVVTYDAVIDVDNSQRLLKPGMTATVTFVYAERQAALRIPNAALRFKPDRAWLARERREAPEPARSVDERIAWLLRAGRAEPVRVHVGISDGVSTELLQGDVHAGDRAILEAISDVKSAS